MAVELWDQRANTNVLLSVLHEDREKSLESLHKVALLGRKRRKNSTRVAEGCRFFCAQEV